MRLVTVICVAALLICTVSGAQLSRHYYTRSLLNGLAPPIRLFSCEDCSVAFVGDSRILHWQQAGNTRGAFLAMPGATTFQVLGVLASIQKIEGYDEVILQVGVNDLKILGIDPSRVEETKKQILSNVQRIAAELVSKNVRVTVLALFPTGTPSFARQFVWSEQVEKTLQQVNEDLGRQTWGDRIRYLNLNDSLASLGDTAFVDAVHLSEPAYDRLSEALSAHLVETENEGR